MERVPPSTVLVPAQSKSRRLAANACWAACVRMADQRERREASTALRRMLGTALAFVWAKRRRKVVASGLHRPPVSRARTTSLHRLERRSSGYVRSLDLRASWSAAPAYWPARLRGWLDEVKGDTKVVSTASCGRPLAITSILLSSCTTAIYMRQNEPKCEFYTTSSTATSLHDPRFAYLRFDSHVCRGRPTRRAPKGCHDSKR